MDKCIATVILSTPEDITIVSEAELLFMFVINIKLSSGLKNVRRYKA